MNYVIREQMIMPEMIPKNHQGIMPLKNNTFEWIRVRNTNQILVIVKSLISWDVNQLYQRGSTAQENNTTEIILYYQTSNTNQQ